MLTQESLISFLNYDKLTGFFKWKIKPSKRINIDSIAGYKSDADKYIRIGIKGKYYLAHRLAWLYMHGYFPFNEIDHINRKRDDNRIINLKLASRQENSKNQSIRKNNTSNVMGVHWCKTRLKWVAHIMIYGKLKNLGYFENKSDAVKKRQSAEAFYNFTSEHR